MNPKILPTIFKILVVLFISTSVTTIIIMLTNTVHHPIFAGLFSVLVGYVTFDIVDVLYDLNNDINEILWNR